MPSAALREFDRQFGADVVPALAAEGFTLGEWQIFRRVVEHERTRSTQIIEFQIGQKGWSIGRFTVNLAVFNRDHFPPSWRVPDGEPQSPECLSDLVQRLGFFRPPDRGVVDRLLGRCPQPHDHWWRQSEDPRVMRKEFAEVMSILRTDGLGWLGARTSLTAFRWALRQLDRRKEWKAALGSPGAPRLFTAEPFPQTS
ncbi:MAG TPA: hypothetical protein VH475_18150 [Tepidisphaeraceae bacterium]|jgi:hypothetical protein